MKKILIIYSLIFITLIVCGAFISNEFLASSLISFSLSIFIIFSSFLAYKKKILNHLNHLTKEQNEEKNEEELGEKKFNFVGINLYKISGYILIVVSFLILQNNNLLSISGFLIGVGMSCMGAIIFGALN